MVTKLNDNEVDYDSLLRLQSPTKKINGKRKGNTFERTVAKHFNVRFGTKDFCRTPGSGAFATSHKHLPEHIRVRGDLITPKNFKYIIECKAGYTMHFEDVFRHNNVILGFIKQAALDAKLAKKKWVVVYQQTRRIPIAVTNEFFPGIKKYMNLNGEYFIYPLEEFLKLPDDIFID